MKTQISTGKGLFCPAVSSEDMKANTRKGYANSSVILNFFKVTNTPGWPTCEMRHAAVSLCLNERETEVCFVLKPDNPHPTKICWLSMNQTRIFLRHLYRRREVLKSVYVLWAHRALYMLWKFEIWLCSRTQTQTWSFWRLRWWMILTLHAPSNSESAVIVPMKMYAKPFQWKLAQREQKSYVRSDRIRGALWRVRVDLEP